MPLSELYVVILLIAAVTLSGQVADAADVLRISPPLSSTLQPVMWALEILLRIIALPTSRWSTLRPQLGH